MEEYFTREEAVKLCLSHQHLVGKQFAVPDGMIYTVNFIVTVPANKYEMDEFRDLVGVYLQTGDRTNLFIFDQRQRKDEFVPVLFGRADLKTGANLLCVPLRSHVDQGGQMKYGYEVYHDHWLT